MTLFLIRKDEISYGPERIGDVNSFRSILLSMGGRMDTRISSPNLPAFITECRKHSINVSINNTQRSQS